VKVSRSDDVFIILTPDEADAAGRMLGEAIKFGYLARGWPVPPLLAEWRRKLASTAQDRLTSQVTGGVGTGEDREGDRVQGSEEPARLTVQEAGNLTGLSEGYVRKLIRRGAVDAVRGQGSAWAVDIASLAVWIRQRRKERDHKAA
jgi:excisionase family DNA binding protein